MTRREKENGSRRDRKTIWIALALAAVAAFGLIRLTIYGINWLSSRQAGNELTQVYEEAVRAETGTETPALPKETPQEREIQERETPAPEAETTEAAEQTEPPAPPAAALAAQAEVRYPDILPEQPYPGNPGLLISGGFQALQEKNPDIVGRLKIRSLLEETVVQRDNAYYQDHDALGRKNTNGALFLDAGISLKTRPYTLMIYGHNMKSGAMFGSLRNYEELSFYRHLPFITFDSLYEEGRYVIFSVCRLRIDTEEGSDMDYFALTSSDPQERQKAIKDLEEASIYTAAVDVRADDQLLLLITCTDREEDRRVIAARRIREEETEKELQEWIRHSVRKE